MGLALQVLLLFFSWCFGYGPLVVNTTYGPVQGYVDGGSKARAWLGLPYAKAPIPRLLPPQPPKSWQQIRPANGFGPSCIQEPIAGLPFRYSEDCLFLNVFAPLEATAKLSPVIVWIHGGGFQSGMSTNYNGTYLAATGVVVVTLNYRLNAFGFMFIQDDPRMMNLGIQDQRLALQWVQQNIKQFGGDPSRVTIMGESAGSASAFFHTCEKESWPLFRSIVAESAGPGIWPSSSRSLSIFGAYARDILNCSDLQCLQQLPAEKLMPHFAMGLSPFVYVWDERIIPFQPQTMVAKNLTRPNTAHLMGTNAIEPSLFSWMYMNNTLVPPTQDQYNQLQVLQMQPYGALAGQVARKYYPFNTLSPKQNFLNLASPLIDLIVVCASQEAAKSLQVRSDTPTYRYYWTVAPKGYIVTQLGLGATHTVEIPFFFGFGGIFGFQFTLEEEQFAKGVTRIIRDFAASGTAPWKTNETYVFDMNGSHPVSSQDAPCDMWSPVLSQETW